MSSTSHSATRLAAAPGVREHLAIVLMLVSVLFVLPPFGLLWAIAAWIVGATLLWLSPVWNPGEKALGTLVWPGGLIAPVVLMSSATQVCSYVSSGGDVAAEATEPVCSGFALGPWLGLPVTLVAFGAPIVVGVVLLSRASSRRGSGASSARS